MLVALLASGLLLAVAAAALLVVSKIVSNRLALIRFKKLSRGLPMFPNAKLLGNHLTVLAFGEYNCESLRKLHQQWDAKTIGFLMSDDFAVSTIDLNLIKTFIMDEQGVHMSRHKCNLPMDEFESSIMLARGDEWRRLRKMIAPAFA
jgi:hypothetical protein